MLGEFYRNWFMIDIWYDDDNKEWRGLINYGTQERKNPINKIIKSGKRFSSSGDNYSIVENDLLTQLEKWLDIRDKLPESVDDNEDI